MEESSSVDQKNVTKLRKLTYDVVGPDLRVRPGGPDLRVRPGGARGGDRLVSEW